MKLWTKTEKTILGIAAFLTAIGTIYSYSDKIWMWNQNTMWINNVKLVNFEDTSSLTFDNQNSLPIFLKGFKYSFNNQETVVPIEINLPEQKLTSKDLHPEYRSFKFRYYHCPSYCNINESVKFVLFSPNASLLNLYKKNMPEMKIYDVDTTFTFYASGKEQNKVIRLQGFYINLNPGF